MINISPPKAKRISNKSKQTDVAAVGVNISKSQYNNGYGTIIEVNGNKASFHTFVSLPILVIQIFPLEGRSNSFKLIINNG